MKRIDMSLISVVLMALFVIQPLAVFANNNPDMTAAIVVTNRISASENNKMAIIEDLVISKVADLGWRFISSEVVINAVSGLTKDNTENAVDKLLSDQTSSLQLAQTLGANYLFFVSLVSYDSEKREVNAYGVQYSKTDYKLRLAYRIIDGGSGHTLTSQTALASRSIQQDKHATTTTGNIFNDLAEKAAVDIANDLRMKLEQDKIAAPTDIETTFASFQITVGLSDIMIPEVIFDDNGQAHITANQSNVEPLAVTIELNGLTMGTTGTSGSLTQFQARPGLHRLRLSREDLVPWERMVNITDGMKFNVTMQLTDTGLARWTERTQFLQDLKRDEILTSAEAEALRGEARLLEQSGYKIDIKVDTEEGLRIEDNRSLIGQ